MDINNLFTEQGMRNDTGEQRDTWMNDAQQIRQLAQIIQARLVNTRIDGDGTGSAGRRARKVIRPWVQAARLLEKAAAKMEGANAVYLREVVELPARRAKELERKELRRQRLGIAASATQQKVAQSLHTSAHTLNGSPQYGNPQVTPVQAAPQYTPPMPYQFAPSASSGQPVGDIADLFPEAL